MDELEEFVARTEITKVDDIRIKVDKIHFETKEELVSAREQFQDKLLRVNNEFGQKQSRLQFKIDEVNARLKFFE